MRFLCRCVLLGSLLGGVSPLHATTLLWDWHPTPNPGGFTLRRCLVVAPATSCHPQQALAGMPVPGTTRQYEDAITQPACWSVEAQAAQQTSLPSNTACQVPGTVVPTAGAITLTAIPGGLRVRWEPPTFNATTIPEAALTGYEVWTRPDPPGAWSAVKRVPPSVTTWDHTGLTVGTTQCYQIRCYYDGYPYSENATTCAPVTLPPGPGPGPDPPQPPVELPLVPPQNFRIESLK